MKKYDKTLPILEKSLTKRIIEKERKQKLEKSGNLLIPSLYQINQMKAYSFFNSIKEKELKMRQTISKNFSKINAEDVYKNKLLSMNNNKNKTIELKNYRKSFFKEKNGNKGTYNFGHLDYYEPIPGNYFIDSFLSKDNSDFKSILSDTLRNRDELISRKRKENLYKKNIENKYNIKINRIKLYSRNKKLFANALKKNPNYFKKNFQSYIKSLSLYSSSFLDNFNKSNSTISIIRNNNIRIKRYTNDNLPKEKIINKIIHPNNTKYKYIKIKKQIINCDDISKS